MNSPLLTRHNLQPPNEYARTAGLLLNPPLPMRWSLILQISDHLRLNGPGCLSLRSDFPISRLTSHDLIHVKDSDTDGW